MKGLDIIGTGRYVPDKVVTNADFEKIIDTTDEWITTRTGIKQRHFSQGEANWQVAAKAARKAIDDAGIDKTQITVLVVATFTPDYATPSVACMVQKELGLSTKIMAFDINSACSGFMYALEVTNSLMENKDGYALVIGSEQISTRLNMEDRASCVLFGDGAGAAVVKKNDTQWFSVMGAMGNEISLGCNGVNHPKPYVYMDGKEVFKFAVKTIPMIIDELLEKSGFDITDIDHIICHQANERIIKNVSNKYKSVADRFYVNIDKYGNTSAASIAIALDEMRQNHLIKNDQNVIMVGFGAGFTWAGVLLKGVKA